MINIIDKKDCCGCRACEVQCPVNCIKMKADNEGFWYPEIMVQECVRCGMCEKVCPILNKTSKTGKTETLGILAKDDNIRKNSSSGGVFSLIAQLVIEQGGIVFGASFDENMMVHHIGVESSKELEKLRGSKYLQSNTENTYIEAQNELKKGRLVLYSGTACQIEALKNILGREYDNLITIDILCHGVPSPKLWKKYLDYQEKQARAAVRKISFRDKSKGWRLFSVKLEFDNGKEYCRDLNEDIFMQMFLKNICLRPSCHDCRFKDINRNSDITIGDFWGVENVLPELDDDRGISVVLTHSDKGRELIQKIAGESQIKQVETDKALPPSADSRRSVPMHKKREMFFNNIDTYDITKLAGYVKESKITIFIHKVIRKLKRMMKINA